MTFLHKRVGEGSGTFGSDLRDLRELQGVTIEQVVRDTKIRSTILEAFEEDRIADVGDPLFAERHLTTYVRYLGGYEPYFLSRYKQKLKEMKAVRRISDMLPRERGVRGMDLFVGPQLMAIAGMLLLAAILGGYVFWQAHLVRTPPPLELLSPVQGQQLDSPNVMVRGKTMAEAYVTVNGREAAVDQTGSFAVRLDVRRGTTMITVVARRRRGSETILERSVVYDRPLTETGDLFLGNTNVTTSTE